MKFQTIAVRAGLTISNVYHHFGGVLEIKRALTERLLQQLTTDLVVALSENISGDLIRYAEKVLIRIYAILSTRRYAMLIGWVALSTEIDAQDDFVRPIPAIIAVVSRRMQEFLDEETSNRLASEIVYQIAVTGVGEGLIGGALNSALRADNDEHSAVDWIRAHWRNILSEALADAAPKT